MVKDAQEKTPIEIATNPKVINRMQQYLDSMSSLEITYNIDDDDRANEKYNVGDLDQIVEDDEEDKDGNENFAASMSLKAAIQSSLAAASQMNQLSDKK